MPVDDATLSKRHALKLALIYLLIRCIPDVLLYVVNALPAQTIASLTESQGAWLGHVYPVVPLQVFSVPFAFQQALTLLPVLIIEVLLVFLFSAWFLRRRPWAAGMASKRSWIVLILATLIWSYAIRHQLLSYIQGISIDALRAGQEDPSWIDRLPALLTKAYWILTAVIYASTPLWAWLPTWLHFRCLKKPADANTFPNAGMDASTGTHDGIGSPSGATRMAVPLQRATVFVSFLLGCLVLHIALVQATYMGLWPWAANLLRISVPLEALNAIGLPLALSQIVFASLVCALAAYVYVRRPGIDTTSSARLVAKPLLAGFAAYLLTCLLLLALTWFVMWMSPGFAESLVRQLSRAPESSIGLAIGINIAAVVLLCLMSGRLRQSPKRYSVVLAILIVCAAVPAYVGWTLAGSNMGVVGGKPGIAATGELGDARWRSTEQWCTGVVETSHGTWLVGRNEVSIDSASYLPDGVPDLSKLVTADDGTTEPQGRGSFGSRAVLTTLALLQDDGKFKVTAAIPDVACLMVAPQSDTLFLFTGLDRPKSSSSWDREQTAIFRSTDHGTSWQWLKAGFMSEAELLAWNVKPTFTSEKDVWAWGKEPADEDEPGSHWGGSEGAPPRQAADGTELSPTALFYSSDQGATSTVVYGPQPLIAPASYLRELIGEPNADFSGRRDMDQERFVVQVDDKHAYAWASEFMWYRVGEDSHRLTLTTHAELARPGADAQWQITKVTRQPHVRIEHLSTALDGRTYAVLQDKDGEWLAKLDTRNGEWIERQKMPSLLPGFLAEDQTSTRYFWSNGDYQVASQWGETRVSRVLIPFVKDRAEIRTDAHFYTRDGGRSWHQLAIPGYLGVMGLSPRGSKLYWTKGNWYSNDEPVQWQYDLAK